MVRDMTKGAPGVLIFGFWLPVLIGTLFQHIYSLVDSMIVGRYVGVGAFAGVSATHSLNFLIIGFLLGLCSGCSIPVAQAYGEGDHVKMRKFFAAAIYISTVLTVVISTLCVAFTGGILRLIGTPNDVFSEARDYIAIIFAGMLATMLYNLSSGILRAVGNTRTPLIFLIASCVVNTALDYVFVAAFDWGVRGAALATVLSQLLSGVACAVLIFRKYALLRIKSCEWKVEKSFIKTSAAVAVPMGAQFSLTAVGSLILQISVNSLGSAAVAAIGAGQKVYYIFCSAFEAMGTASATWCSQNFGAKRIDRVRCGVRTMVFTMSAYAVVAAIFVRIFGRAMVGWFIDDAPIIENAVKHLNMSSCFFIPLLCIYIFRNALQSVGYSRLAMGSGLVEMASRAFVALVLVKRCGFDGAILANPVAWTAANFLLIPAYFAVVRALEKTYQG